jgi:hypothetical protein
LGDEVRSFGKALNLSNLDEGDSGFQADPNNSGEFIFVAADGKHFRFSVRNNGGCGGGCETISAIVSDDPSDEKSKAVSVETPPAVSWTVYRSDDAGHYLMGVVEDHLEVYRLASPKDFKLSCNVALAPQDLEKSVDPDVIKVLKAIVALNDASKNVTRPDGYCGSGAFGYLDQKYLTRDLYFSLYRPWAVITAQSRREKKDINQEYQAIVANLYKWSSNGLNEQRAFNDYKERFSLAAAALAEFYEKKFGWQSNNATVIADTALMHAISQGLVFSSFDYKPFSDVEIELREALLAHKSMPEIKAIDIDISKIDEPDKDSILNVAIGYPDALRYLLEKKANPNQANAFGKTPLMYAAQYNQLDAAKLLLSFNANPNARTFIPTDQCQYTLKTSNMTALHYAVRYASGDMIRLLVKSGAAPYIKAVRSQQEETSLDWLRSYASEKANERNPFIQPGDVEALTNLLRVPEAELAHIAAKQVASAELHYAKGEMKPAYNAAALALAADPSNQKALADFPLIALKTGRIGEAADAAVQATKKLKTPADQAAAWFNMGLICEQLAGRASNDDGWLNCNGNRIFPFVRAMQLQATASRGKKLFDLLQRKDDMKMCEIAERRYAFEHNGRERVYVLHGANEHIDPESIQLKRLNWDKTLTIQTPRISGTFPLNDKAMTLLEADFFPNEAILEGQYHCKLGYF